MAITGQASEIGHDGITALGESVEQCGFAHIRATDEGQDRFHLSAF